MGSIMALTSMSNTKVTSRIAIKTGMGMAMKLKAQRDMSMSTIRHNPTQNLKALRKVRHTRKVTTSITKQQKSKRLKLDYCSKFCKPNPFSLLPTEMIIFPC